MAILTKVILQQPKPFLIRSISTEALCFVLEGCFTECPLGLARSAIQFMELLKYGSRYFCLVKLLDLFRFILGLILFVFSGNTNESRLKPLSLFAPNTQKTHLSLMCV